MFLVCSEPVGLEDGRIPNPSFSASSMVVGTNLRTKATEARLNDDSSGWRAKNADQEPWLQIDLLYVRLVTGIATHGGSTIYLKTYFLSFGFEPDQLLVYLDGFKQRKVRMHKFLLTNFFDRHLFKLFSVDIKVFCRYL